MTSTHVDVPGSLAERDKQGTVREAALVAGIGLLVMSGLAGFAMLGVLERLVTDGDAERTARDVMGSEGVFRLAIVSLLLVVVLDVVVAWALLRVFRPASAGISVVAAWFRLVYAAVFLVAISELAGTLHLLGTEDHLRVFGADQLHALALLRIEAFTDIWQAGLMLFGVHLALIAYLGYRSGYVPKILGVLVGIAGVGYVFDSVAYTLSQGDPVEVSVVTGFGEFLLAIWLVVQGRRITLNE